MKVDNLSSYTVYRWMHDKLQLSCVRKEVFACIYGCYLNGEEYTGSAAELAKITGYKPLTVYKALWDLTSMGYLIKRDFKNKQNRCAYRVNPEIVKGVAKA